MHILGIILGAVILGLVFYIRHRGVVESASDAVDTAEHARGYMRRRAFRKKAEGSVLSSIDDPAVAAVILLVKIAECKGPVPEATLSRIRQLAVGTMGLKDAAETVLFAQWICGEVVEPGDVIRVFTPLLNDKLDHGQRLQFVDMLGEISAMSITETAEQRDIRETLTKKLL